MRRGLLEYPVSEPESFDELMSGLRRGDDAAASELFRRYARQLVRLAAPRLVGVIRRKVDAEDLVQSAFRSFFRVDPARSFDLDGWDDLWGLLATITLRKCRYWVRHYLAAKRHVGREMPPGDDSADWDSAGRDPTPAEAVVLSETVERLLGGLDEKGRLVAEMVLQGFTAAEIAPHAGLTERSVYRQLERVRGRLREIGAAAS